MDTRVFRFHYLPDENQFCWHLYLSPSEESPKQIGPLYVGEQAARDIYDPKTTDDERGMLHKKEGPGHTTTKIGTQHDNSPLQGFRSKCARNTNNTGPNCISGDENLRRRR